MANSLGAGSGRPGIPLALGDFSVAGVVNRVTTSAPVDADWGNEAPPNGTVVFQIDGSDLIIWVRWSDTWRQTILEFTA